MHDKNIKIKLRKIPSSVGGRVYKIESMTNAVGVDTGFSNLRRVGDEIGETEADYLCADRRTEVLVS